MPYQEIKGVYDVPVRIWADIQKVESEALTQLRKVSALPWVHSHVAAMPDVHLGVGATVGSVIAMKQAISPAAVGVDIGCGMAAVRTSLKAEHLPDSLVKIREEIEKQIPVGNGPGGSNASVSKHAKKNDLWTEFKHLSSKVQDQFPKTQQQCGTLGGGNHFIELCLDTEDNVWLMLHSGSRNIGKTLAEIHISKAKALTHNHDPRVMDRDLAVFLAGTKEMEDYRRDLYWAQRYAALNRHVMLTTYQDLIWDFFAKRNRDVKFEAPISCHHNYVAEEHHFGEDCFVTRKGAISAKKDELGIIPGSMGTKSYIVRGLGNPESFQSASHGAGRKMSRGKAKAKFSIEDLAEQTKGVECRKDSGVLDEIPGAYKPIEEVMANQSDLVEIVSELKQVLCVKG
jgi:tRNA-splicing ligase RtcB